MATSDKTAGEIADVIDRYVSNSPINPFEWGDLVDCGARDPELSAIIRQCEIIGAAFEPDPNVELFVKRERELRAIEKLKACAAQLREMEKKKLGE